MSAEPAAVRDYRPIVQVACGVLQKPTGEVLLAQRPPGKLAAGKWEFPGGKIEVGESPRQALARELNEELGIELLEARPLARLLQDYSDRRVWLDTWLVTRFADEPEPKEGQTLVWTRPEEIGAYDVLPSCWRVAAALRLPGHYVFTSATQSEHAIIDGLAALPPRSLLRLRLPGLDDQRYSILAERVIAAARQHEIDVMLDRDVHSVGQLCAAGWHSRAKQLRLLKERPVPTDCLFLASAHDADELRLAHALNADAVVLGSVLMTSSHLDQMPLGWPGFAALAGNAGLPVYALGGVGPEHDGQARDCGAFGLAGISAYWS